MRRIVSGGTLGIRVIAAGVLLLVGLPILTVFLYLWGFPATRVPLPIVVFVDGLQLLIVAYAAVIGAQLLARAGAAATRFSRSAARAAPEGGNERPPGEAPGTASGSSSGGWGVLREGALGLADLIWRQEQRGRPEFGQAALAYVRDAVAVELEYRRRAAILRRRAAELEDWIAQDSVVASERM